MKTALIGSTGFVGSNLAAQYRFSELYNSKNINDISGKQFDLVVCAGVQAVKWWANKNPNEDWQGIQKLIDALVDVQAERFLLISTVDIYPVPLNVNEATIIDTSNLHAYGLNRLRLESQIKKIFSNTTTVRLPGLFSKGLKKNVIYDLMNNNCLDVINRESSFQYYYLNNLWSDLNLVLSNGISSINLVTEPLSTGEILDAFFPGKVVGEKASAVCHYDIKTLYADIKKREQYFYSKSEVLESLAHFLGST